MTNRIDNRVIKNDNYVKSERLSRKNLKPQLHPSNKNMSFRKSKNKLIADPKSTFI